MFQYVFPALSATAAITAAVVAVWVAFRSGKWRESDDAKALVARLSKVERDQEMTDLKLVGAPSQADIAGLKAEIRTLEVMISAAKDSSARTERAVERMENHMMRVAP